MLVSLVSPLVPGVLHADRLCLAVAQIIIQMIPLMLQCGEAFKFLGRI